MIENVYIFFFMMIEGNPFQMLVFIWNEKLGVLWVRIHFHLIFKLEILFDILKSSLVLYASYQQHRFQVMSVVK